jgi:hypothetical protein
VFSSGPSGFSFVSGTLPQGAFHSDAKSASLDIDIADIEDATGFGFPDSGVISVDWAATDVSRTSGNTKLDMGPVTANIVGTTTFTVANISGSVLGVDMVAPTGYLNLVHTSVIVHIDTKP